MARKRAAQTLLPGLNYEYTPDPNQIVYPVLYSPYHHYVYYACPDERWEAHHKAWCKAYGKWKRSGENGIHPASPMSPGHCMFENPRSYGLVEWGETRPHVIRRAIRHSVLSMLDSWDRELRKTPAGMRKLAAIVRAAVGAKLTGTDLGGLPFVSCILAEAD